MTQPPRPVSWWRPSQSARFPSAKTGWIAAASGTVLFICAALAVHGGAPAWDAHVFRFFNEVPSALASVLTPLSRLASPIAIGVVVVLVGTYTLIRNRSLFPIIVAACTGGGAWLFASLAKAVAERPRPYEVIAGAILRQNPAHGTSFPSSHTAVAFAVAIALLPFLPRPIGVTAIGYAVLVGWSRMYLGVHYPLDVLGGAGIGMASGGAALLIAGRIVARAGIRKDGVGAGP